MRNNCVEYYRKKYAYRTRNDLWNPFTAYLVESRAKLTSYAYGYILDIGCGDGYFSIRLLEDENEVYGIDLGYDLLQEAQHKGIKAVLCDAQSLCFDSSSFDTVILLETLEHLQVPKDCLKEIYYILRKDGLLILSVPAKTGIIVQSLEMKSKLMKKSAPIHHLYTIREISELVEQSGYKIIRCRHFAFYNSIFVIAKKIVY